MSFDYRQCIQSVLNYLPNNPVVFDVGCNINPIIEMGNVEWIENWNDDFTFLFLEKFPQSKCIAIEPMHWEKFEERWGNDSRVDLLKIALSDKDGSEFLFFPGQRHVLSSFYIREDFKGEPLNLKEVECKKLDTLFQEYQLDKIDYLKIDTEGAEYKILLGAKKLLEQKKITFVQFEYGLIDGDIPSVDLIENLLTKYDYHEVTVSGREKLWTYINDQT
jgi:FkbM family methyltransferase